LNGITQVGIFSTLRIPLGKPCLRGLQFPAPLGWQGSHLQWAPLSLEDRIESFYIGVSLFMGSCERPHRTNRYGN